jgi:hypothetical protein
MTSQLSAKSEAGNAQRTAIQRLMGYASYSNYGGVKQTGECLLASFIEIT